MKFYCMYCGHSSSSITSLTMGSCRNSPNGKHIPYEGDEKKQVRLQILRPLLEFDHKSDHGIMPQQSHRQARADVSETERVGQGVSSVAPRRVPYRERVSLGECSRRRGRWDNP